MYLCKTYSLLTNYSTMKKILLSIIILFLTMVLKAQSCAYVEPLRAAVIYANLPCPLVLHSDVSADKVTLVTSAGRIEQEGDRYYLITPDSMMGKRVTVSILDTKTMNEIGSSKFLVYKVPDPFLFLGANISNRYKTYCTAEEMLKHPILRATMNVGFIYDIKWTVESFRITIIRKGKVVVDTVCKGDTIPQSVQRTICTAPTNTSITFREIKVHSSFGDREIENMTVFIE